MSIYGYSAVEHLSVDHLSGAQGVTQKIKDAMKDAAKQFVYIGFLLWEVKHYEYFYDGNYGSVYEYAEAELGFKRSSTKNFIAICETFCRKNENYKELPTMFLDDRWSDFQYSQLTEMLSMSAAQRQQSKPDMTVKQLRQLKKVPETEQTPIDQMETTGQTSGQSDDDEDDLQTILVNNLWADADQELVKALCKAANIRYNPKSCYDIEIKLHKG